MQAKIVNLLLMFLALAISATVPAHSGEQKPVGRPIEQPGYAAPFEQVDVYARITGYIEKVPVDLGDHVKKGQLLAKLAAPELEQKLEKKKAMIHKAQAGVAKAKAAALVSTAAVARSMAGVEDERASLAKCQAEAARWQEEVERARILVQKGVYDKKTLDEVVNQWKAATASELQAKATVKAAEAMQKDATARRDKGNAEVEMAQADLQAARAEAAEVDAMLQYAEIRAPFDGVVIRRNANTGRAGRPTVECQVGAVVHRGPR